MSAPLEKPRWPGGPKICPSPNLPAFESKAALKAFLSANSPSCKVLREYECPDCGHWHANTLPPDPAGASSGQGRSSKYTTYEAWAKFFAAKTPGDLVDETLV